MDEKMLNKGREILEEIISQTFTMSTLNPKQVGFITQFLTNFYVKNTVFISTDYVELAHKLYEFKDNQMYSIVAVSTPEYEYLMFLVKGETKKTSLISRGLLNVLKEESTLVGEQMGAFVTQFHADFEMWKELIQNSTRSTRLSVSETNVDDFVSPSKEDLQLFYECGRKTKFVTIEEANDRATSSGKNVYKCSHCGYYHVGSEPSGMNIPSHVMEGRWRTAYRRKNRI